MDKIKVSYLISKFFPKNLKSFCQKTQKFLSKLKNKLPIKLMGVLSFGFMGFLKFFRMIILVGLSIFRP
jgi:hypothetical protein